MSDYVIKEAKTEYEIERIKDFLLSWDKIFEEDINYSLYAVQGDDIIATISLSDYIIKCLCVKDEYKDGNLEKELINKLIDKLKNDNKYYYVVFTEIKYESIFLSLGFNKIVSTFKTSMLEYGTPLIDTVLDRLKQRIESSLDCKLDESKVCGIVLSADPFTNGHLSLVEEGIVRKYDYILVFVLSENKGFFTDKERLSLAYVSLLPYENVIVIPSTKYIVSQMTFPGYFLHEDKYSEWARIDALVFRDHFMRKLNISKRFVGSETDELMIQYNDILKEVLGDKLEIIERIKLGDKPISAKDVRNHIKLGNLEEVQRLVPRASWVFYKQILERYTNNGKQE